MTSDRTLEEGIFTDFEGRMSYSDYLCLDKVLTAQRPVSDSPDELLFITIHQATELWMKLMRHEVLGATSSIAADDLQPAFKMLARVSRIQAQIIHEAQKLTRLFKEGLATLWKQFYMPETLAAEDSTD